MQCRQKGFEQQPQVLVEVGMSAEFNFDAGPILLELQAWAWVYEGKQVAFNIARHRRSTCPERLSLTQLALPESSVYSRLLFELAGKQEGRTTDQQLVVVDS